MPPPSPGARRAGRAGTSGNELDPAGLTSLDDLADALRGLHRRSGELSLRDLERWARKQQQVGRPDG
ncbi:MAG TPA: hypothetical protein VJT72_10265, partial [Pseudonocardiaceae bacterium]|nr:hypothetical protein [Pseudonocardiaceae bacterium]